MRVTVVTTWLPTAHAPSSGSFVVRDCAAIRDAGAQVRLIHLVAPRLDDGTRRLTLSGMPVHRIPMRPSNPASVALAASRLPALIEGAQVLHSMAVSSLLPLSLLDASGSLRLPWVHTEHWSGLTNPATLSAPLRAGRLLVGHQLTRPDVVTAVCEYLAAPIRAHRAEAPTVVVPCIVDPVDTVPRRGENLPPGAPDGAAGPGRTAPQGQEDGEEELRLVAVGGLIERKDPLACLDVLAELIARGRRATLTFVGEGPLRGAIEQRAGAEPALRERVRLTGTLDAPGVRRELAAADLLLGPTRGDNFFVSAAEAIVSGRPVVVSDAGGQTEYVTDGNGAIVPAGADAAQWARAVTDTLARLRGRSAAQIAATIGDRFSAPVVGAAYRELHASLL